MISKRHNLGKFLVIEISYEFSVIADLQELDIFVDGLIAHGNLFIAVRFSEISYIYSGALGVLIKAAKRIREQHGQIVLLEPNREVHDIIRTVNLDTIIRMFDSEEELLAAH